MITDAFSDVLEDLRTKSSTEDDPIDVETLVDCLQSGLDLLNQGSKYYSRSLSETDFESGDGGGNVSGDELTPHESRRRQLGFAHVKESTA